MSALEHRVEIAPAYDLRSQDPKKNFGVHGVEMRFLVIGLEGAVQFLLCTNWHLPHVQEELDRRLESRFPHLSCHPRPTDLGYHSRSPMWEGQEPIGEDCPYVGGTCYYDGSSLNADEFYRVLVAEGGDAMWAKLEAYYHATFNAAKGPA